MARYIPAATGYVYGWWLDEQYSAATGDRRWTGDPGFEEAAHRWRVKEVARGRDFYAEWEAKGRPHAAHGTR